MIYKTVFWIALLGLIFLSPAELKAKKSEKKDPPLPSLTGKIILLEPRVFSSVIQVKKNGQKGGLRSVRAIVNSKTQIHYKGNPFSFNDLTLNSIVRLEYERVKGVIVARTITVKKLYTKPNKKKLNP